MKTSRIKTDLVTLARQHERSAPELGTDPQAAVHQLAKFLLACEIGAHSALAMLMKCAVEHRLADDATGKWPVSLLTAAMTDAYGDDWSHEKLWLTLLEIAAMNLHTLPIDAGEIRFYESQQLKDDCISAGVSRADRARYEKKKKLWRKLHAELDQLVVHRENRLLQREALRQAFMREFPMYLEECDQRLRHAVAELKTAELAKNPTLSAGELDALAAGQLDEANAKLTADRRTMGYALTAGECQLEGFSNEEAYREYRKRLKTLYMLLHPDRLLHVPLTDGQRRELRELWDDCQAVNVKGAAEHELGRSAELVEYCIERARAILEHAGIDIDPGLIIRGDTLEERCLWLERAILRVQNDIEILKDELKAWRDDPELNAMIALMRQSADEKERQRAAMRERSADFAARADALEQELARKLARENDHESD